MKNYFNTLIQYSIKQNYINIEQAKIYHLNRLQKQDNIATKTIKDDYIKGYIDYLSEGN